MYALRKSATCLLWLILLVHAALPAVPGFVCVGMGGAHRLAPCCPGSDGDRDAPAWTSRCCEAAPAPALEAWRGPPEALALASPPALLTSLPTLPPPVPTIERRPLPRSGAPPPGPPQPRYVLRI